MKTFLRIIVIAVLIIIVWRLVFHVDLHGEIEDSGIWTDTIPKEYSQLLKLPDSCCKSGEVTFVNTQSNKYRNPVSRFYIDGKYYLQVYKMTNSFNSSLKNAIKESFSDSSPSNTEYTLDDRTDFQFLYKLTKPDKPKEIYFALYGDSTRILKKNDTIAYYFSKCTNLSIRFSPEKENDIYGKYLSHNPDKMPLEVMFLKRLNNLYMFVLSSKVATTNLKEGTLYKLFYK